MIIKTKFYCFFFLVVVNFIFSQENIVDIGHITSFETGLPVIFSKICFVDLNKGTNSYKNWDYKLIIEDGFASRKIIADNNTTKLLIDKERLIRSLQLKGNIYKYTISFLLIITCIISAQLLYYYWRQKLPNKKLDTLVKKNHWIVQKRQQMAYSCNNLETKIPKEIVERVLLSLNCFKEQKQFLNANLTLYELAKNLQTNHTYLSKIINVYECKNFSAFINELRIEYAIQRLQTDDIFTKYTIDAIAEESGFSNTRSFRRAFKRKMNINPSYFIENFKKQS